MKTQLFKIQENYSIREQLKPAVEILKNGGLVVFPTETVYGLGANGLQSNSVKKIFEAKGRPSDNPLILHISSLEMLEQIADFYHPYFPKLIQEFWPGPLTFILPKKDTVPSEACGGLKTVAVRMPYHPVALNLIHTCGFPLAAPSANISGRPSPTHADMVLKDLDGKVPLIIDSGACSFGLESTVLDLTGERPAILRPGSVTYEHLKVILPDLKPVEFLENHSRPIAPGMKYLHYKPNVPVVLVCDASKIQTVLNDRKPSRPVYIGLTPILKGEVEEICFQSLDEMAQKLYFIFYQLERKGFDLIIVEKQSEKGIGAALMNRVNKAADEIY